MKKLFSLICLITFSLYSSISICDVIKIKDADFKKINQKLALHLELEPLKKATGYYSTKSEKLHGEFDLGEEYTGYDVEHNAFYLYKNKVSGSFKQGMKEGMWKYSYVFDDGLELYERHNIAIQYDNGKCVASSFDGVIGHIMPISNYKFNSNRLCTPNSIREKAWQLWSQEHKKS